MLKEEAGFGTIEVVIILAILVGIALLFKNQITAFVEGILSDIVNQDFDIGSMIKTYVLF